MLILLCYNYPRRWRSSTCRW